MIKFVEMEGLCHLQGEILIEKRNNGCMCFKLYFTYGTDMNVELL